MLWRRFFVFSSSLLLVVSTLACESESPGGDDRAAALYENCATCHGADGSGNEAVGAPAIAGLEQWYVKAQLDKFMNGARGAHPEDVNGLKMRPMARILRGEEDVQVVSALVASMPPAADRTVANGNAERGQALFAPCITCHGQDASGDREQNAPSLTRSSGWYLVGQLQKFKDGVRGTNAADTTGAQMRPMAMTLADEQAMQDVVAYISTL